VFSIKTFSGTYPFFTLFYGFFVVPNDEPPPFTLRPSTEWPLLLLGPFVRKVTRTKAHIFIATKERCSAQILIREGFHAYTALNDGSEADQVELHQLGLNLYVGLLEVDLPNPGAENVYSYDVQLRDLGSTGPLSYRRLNDLGLLGNPDFSGNVTLESHAPLGYAQNLLPSFVTPPDNPLQLRIAQASCRKPHGNPDSGYEPDAVPILDEIIARAIQEREIEDAETNLQFKDYAGNTISGPQFPPTELTERPHQLILTGDQIYADDVAPALLDTIISVSEELFGWHEALPGINEGVNGFLVQPGWRSRYLVLSGVKEPAKDLKSDYDQSHLLRFAEWVTMYMMAWSPALWPRTPDESKVTLREAKPRLPISEAIGLLEMAEWINARLPQRQATQPVEQGVRRATPITALLDYAAGKARDQLKAASDNEKARNEIFTKTREPAIQYGSTAVYVRRVLANTPTYTMFDDHEITDDWFVTRDVAERLLGYDPISASAPMPGPTIPGPNGTVPPENFWGAHVGPRILRNGLSAYAIFQHWGNVPEDFAGWQNHVASPASSFDNWEADGISIGARLLHLWRPGGQTPHPLSPPLAGPHVDPDIIRGTLWWAGTGGGTPPPGTQDEWLAYTWAPHSETRAADDLLRIGDAPDASTGLIPVTGTPENRAAFKSFRWDYAIEFDSHRLIALDSRTWRRFPTDANTNPIPGVNIPTTTLMARDATAGVLETYAQVWTGRTNQPCVQLGLIMQNLADVLQATYLDNPPAGVETFATRSTRFGASILTFVTGAQSPALQQVSDAMDTYFAEVNATADARYTTRPAMTDDKGYWLRAAAILKEVAKLTIANQDVSKPMAALGHYVDRLSAGSEVSAVRSLRKAINVGADLTDLLSTLNPASQQQFYLQPTVTDLAAIQAGRVAAIAALTAAQGAMNAHESSERLFRDGSGYMAAELISEGALTWMVTEPITTLAPQKETVILASAPIFGVNKVEQLQRAAVAKGTIDGLPAAEGYDFEAWSANPVGFDNLMIAAKDLKRAIVLSGDVHYGFSSVNQVTIDRMDVDTTYVQFCSSASKNSDGVTKKLGTFGYLVFDESPDEDIAQFNGAEILRDGWGYWKTVNGDQPLSNSEALFLEWLDAEIEDTISKTAQEYHLDDLQLMRAELLAVRTPADYLNWQVRWFLQPPVRALGQVAGNPQHYSQQAYNYLSQAPKNALIAFKDESLWSMVRLYRDLVAAVNDPKKAVFGHRLYGRDVLNRLAFDAYRQMGIDASYGYHIRTRSLSDTQGFGRLALYGARYRYSLEGKNEPKMRYANIQETHIVGSANVGLVRFINTSAGPGALHHMLFYPDPSHPGMVTKPPGPLLSSKVTQPDIGEVTGLEHPRMDWMATRHEGSFDGTIEPIGALGGGNAGP